jgi:hypothetical protein
MRIQTSRAVMLASLGLVLLASGCQDKTNSSGSVVQSRPGTTSPAGSVSGPSAAAEWNMNVKSLEPPATPAMGRVGGGEFKPDRVILEADQLTLRQGKEFFADREVKILLNGDNTTLEGKKFVVAPDQGFAGDTPHIHLSWKKPGEQLPQSEIFLDKYAMKLEFGTAQGAVLPGKIYLSLPDQAHSFVAGSFQIESAAVNGGQVHGRVSFKGQAAKEYSMTAGYVGSDATGKIQSGFVGTTIEPGGSGFVKSGGSRLDSKEKDGVSFRHVQIPTGNYLVYIGWSKRALAWRWVEVKDKTDTAVDLTVDPENVGDLEVTISAGSKERRVEILPLPGQGEAPVQPDKAIQVANQFAGYFRELSATVPSGQDRVSFAGLAAGRYRVFAGKTGKDVEVTAKSVARVNLGDQK